MADESVVSEIVTKFLLNTCRLRPQLTCHAIDAVETCVIQAIKHPVNDAEAEWIPLITGSVAEFYIDPILPLVGDIDMMFHASTGLAIPRGHPPPTQLPDEFSNYVHVAEIVDSHLPGYVYLELRYLLTECTEDDKYNYVEYVNGLYYGTINSQHRDDGRIHGPSLRHDFSVNIYKYTGTPVSALSIDNVQCVRCLSWPSQAADWPTRHRNHDWPDSATVDHVVNNGCDVVHVAHRQCKQHEWMGLYQWRLSFSRAEIVLINSWMPVQQIVYHMLRYFMKNNQLIDSADNSERFVISNYHIKTLMLWTSERKPRNWWTESLNLVRICVELLHTLSVCLTDKCCPQYFISNCNLLDNSLSVGMVANELMLIDEACLSTWFVNTYIRECAQVCPDHVVQMFDDASTVTTLQKAASAIVQFRLNTSPYVLFSTFDSIKGLLSMYISYVTARTYVWRMKWLTKIDVSLGLPEYFTAVTLLHVAYRITKTGFDNKLMDLLAAVLGQFNHTPRYSKQHCSVSSLNTAAKLMKVAACELQTTMQLIEIELSKAYLYRALRCKDSNSDSVSCLANVYLAILFYTTGQYQTAMDHCTLVTKSQDHSQCSSHVVQGELLPKIDDDIDNILGLTVFYQYVLSAALNQQQHRQYVSVFTTEMFAYYLHCSLLSFTQCRQVTQMSLPVSQQCATYMSEIHQLFIGDALVFKSLNIALQQNVCDKPNWRKYGRPAANAIDLNTPKLVELLQRSAVEHLTTFRQLEARYFGSVATIVTTDFEALYAYKHGDYQRCLQLSTQNVHALLYQYIYDTWWSYVILYSECVQLLDDDIVSLNALTLIVNPKCRHKEAGNVCISQMTLSLYLMTQCQLKLRHSVTSLAQTLDYIDVAQRNLSVDRTLSQLILKLAECKIATYMRMIVMN